MRVTAGIGLLLLTFTTEARATVLDFEDLQTRNNFAVLGIAATYQGYQWGYNNTPGLAGATIPATDPNGTGWASQTILDPAIPPMPAPVSGTAAAWNWGGALSLIIDFGSPTDVEGGYFAFLSSSYAFNASSIQMFGYDAAQNLVASSGLLALGDKFQPLIANFTGVTFLEIRSNSDFRWFSVDDISISPSVTAPVPEPATLALLGAGLLAGGRRLRVRRE